MLQASERSADVEGALRTHPLSDERGGVVAEGGEVLAGGDRCFFRATLDLSQAPRRVGVIDVGVYTDAGDVPAAVGDEQVSGSARLQAVPVVGRHGDAARVVLADVDV